jgi:hypothetical protein
MRLNHLEGRIAMAADKIMVGNSIQFDFKIKTPSSSLASQTFSAMLKMGYSMSKKKMM